MSRPGRIATFCGILTAAAACSVLSPQKDRSRFYLLTPATEISAVAPATAVGREVALGVGPISFPGYLKRPEVVTRVGSDRLELSEENRWAEPLDSNFQRVLAQDLARALSTQRVVMFPWYGSPRLDYRVEVQVHRFDTDAQGRSELSANWLIRDGRNGNVLFVTDTTTNSSAAAADANASVGLSRALGSLSEQIAEQIDAFERKRIEVSNSERKRGGTETPGD